MNSLELFGVVTGVAGVWLLARQSVWNWPVSLANNMAYAVVFVNSGLYGDAGLQGLYAGFGLYGWWTWLRTPPAQLPVRLTGAGLIMASLAAVTAAVLLYGFLRWYTDSTVPLADAVTTALALVATALQARKFVECWWLWIAADVIYIPLYWAKDLYWTAGLYAIFLGLCVQGLRSWRRDLNHSCD